MSSDRKITVLFVCTGNICRSPMAEVVASQTAAALAASSASNHSRPTLEFKSAGTAGWHVGEPMDARAAAVLRSAGFDPDGHRAQHATDDLLAEADVIVALDRKHAQILKGRLPAQSHDRIIMLRAQDPASGGKIDVADPYYGDDVAFAECLEIVTSGVVALVENLTAD